jgi:hypothetical protein
MQVWHAKKEEGKKGAAASVDTPTPFFPFPFSILFTSPYRGPVPASFPIPPVSFPPVSGFLFSDWYYAGEIGDYVADRAAGSSPFFEPSRALFVR